MNISTECSHLRGVQDVTPSSTRGCEECLAAGSPWLHLRLCLTCGHVGCCDDSPMKHATAHFHGSGHPVIKSFEPGENWGWCYVDEIMYEEVPGPSPRHHIGPPARR